MLFCILLFIPYSFTAIEEPQLAQSAQITIDESGTIRVIGGSMEDLSLNLSIPASEEYQQVSADEPVYKDENGNSFIRIYSASPANPFSYSRSIRVGTRARISPELPASYIVPAEISRYVLPTSRTQSDDGEIAALARKITADAEDPFEKVAKIAIWINENIEYDAGLVGQEKDALSALKERRGVCVEYSTLFAALARAAGIPTRYITGYAYSEKFAGWLGHAWNEAYIGKWVPVDATWFEVGATDALHIEGGKFPELSHEAQLVASVTPPEATIEWEREGMSGARADNIKTESISYFEPRSDYVLEAAEDELAPGGKTIAYFSIVGKDYRVIEVGLAPCLGEGSVAVKGGTQRLILRPGRLSTAVWELSAAKDLDARYLYTCPLTLNSPVLAQKTLVVRIDPRLGNLPDYAASIAKNGVAPGENNSVIFSLPPSRQAKDYVVVVKDGIYRKRISAPADTVEFASRGIGRLTVYAAGQGGGFHRLEYWAVAGRKLRIDGFALSKPLIAGKGATAEANVSAESYPADIEIEFYFGNQSARRHGRISGPSSFSFEFFAPSAGQYAAKVRLIDSAGDVAGEKAEIADVQAQPKVRIAGVKRSLSGDQVLLTLSFEQEGKPVGPRLSVGGQEYPARDRAEILLAEGSYPIALYWKDEAGNLYESRMELEVRKPGILGDGAQAQGLPATSQPAPPCPIAAAILISAFACFTAKRE
ncbi:MAG: transglutaminase-like domain-containing protein [Candidatus Micrarchaeota archaeon]|nr:transglutaminase-like domain-containing protein [Candidatus Micrarchaeota archaeon]